MNKDTIQRGKTKGGRRNMFCRSAIRKEFTRRGGKSAITLTEVLIAMGILTLGLLGVAALFPVGGYYMQKAEIADNGSAIARSALADVVARGMLNPDTWRVYDDGFLSTARTGTGPAFGTSGTFLRQVGLAVRQQLALLNSSTTLLAADRQWCLSAELGSAYVLDPIGVASVTLPYGYTSPAASNQRAFCFPATAYSLSVALGKNLQYYYPHVAWSPWYGTSQVPWTWPIRRATFGQSNTTTTGGREQQSSATQLRSVYAGDLFSSQDDLALDLPDRDDLPARQNWELYGSGGSAVPLARQWRGDYSWIITVAPPTSAARDALGDGGRGYEYNVSVVVFYKRAIARSDPDVVNPSNAKTEATNAARVLQGQERTVRAKVVSTGLSGGELLLERQTDYVDGSPFDVLKVGEWLMLCGPHRDSTPTDPRFVLDWYRVVAIDGEDQALDEEGNPATAAGEPERRLVTLRGPEWPWRPAADLTDDGELSNWLCVGICPGAVAVHTRTMQLEGPSPWSIE